jgi:hypothetical protein
MFAPHPTTAPMLIEQRQRELLDHAARIHRAAELKRHHDAVPRIVHVRLTARRLAAGIAATLLAGAVAGSVAALSIDQPDQAQGAAPASLTGGAGPKLIR